MTNEQIAGMLDFLMRNAESEARITAKVLAAIPADRMEFKLGDKGRTTLELARHIAAVDVWFLDSIVKKSFVEEADETVPGATPSDIASWYTANFAEQAANVRVLPPEHLATPVDFYGMFQLPVIRYLSFLANHSIHHRGQLSTYLRAMNAHVPSIYGPSADEGM